MDVKDIRSLFNESAMPAPLRAGALASLREALHTSSFRLLALFVLVVAASLVLLTTVIQFTMTSALQRAMDSGIRWQLRYFDSTPAAEIPALIARRIDKEHGHATWYGWFDPQGRRLAGNIVAIPAAMSVLPATAGHERADGQSLPLDVDHATLDARVMGDRRPDGQVLVVGRSLDDVEDIREELTRAIEEGGALCTLVIVGLGVAFGVRQIRRAAEIRRATIAIAGGSLELRLPVGGDDELDMLASLVNRMLDDIERLIREIKGTCDGIAHDLRSPIVRLRLQLGELDRHAEAAGDPAGRRKVARVMAEADAVLERFTAMLRISELGTMRRKAGFSTIAPGELLDDLVALYQPLAEEKHIELVAELRISSVVTADRSLLFEAFSNLMDNAIKFTPAGGIIRVRARETGKGPSVTIEDTGPGIAVEERDAVLQQFYRSGRTRQVPGTGLGLAIVAAIVRLHDFRIIIGDADISGFASGTRMTVDCWPHSLN